MEVLGNIEDISQIVRQYEFQSYKSDKAWGSYSANAKQYITIRKGYIRKFLTS